MKQAGWSCTALDPDARACEHARNTVGVNAIHADFVKDEGFGRFHVIAFNKVLEHVPEPVAMLRKAARHLEPGEGDPMAGLYEHKRSFGARWVEMTGTTDLMPGVSLDQSEVTLTKAALNAFRHISTVVTFGSPTNSIKVVCRLKNFVAAHHTLNVAIHHSGTTHLDGTEVYEPAADDGTIVVTTTFSVSSVTTCQVELTGTTDGVGENFIVMQRIIYCT